MTRIPLSVNIILVLATTSFVSRPVESAPPNTPVLSRPANGTTDVAVPPTLDVLVSDPENQSMTVTFYGRPLPSVENFTLIVVPDIQEYTASKLGGSPAILQSQIEWIVNSESERNIAFVTQLGDLVDNPWDSNQWAIADSQISALDDAGIPYGIAVGNADEIPYEDPNGTAVFNSHFGVSRYQGRSYYGGHYGNDNDNSYQFFSASGLNFLVVHLEFNASPDPSLLDWVDGLLQTYSERRAILVIHNLLETNNSFSVQAATIFQRLKARPNLFLMLGGHKDDEGRRIDLGADGQRIYSLRSDYQYSRPNGGNGFLRVMQFSPSDNLVFVSTYSPYVDQYETDASSEFTLEYDMGGSDFQVLGVKTGVASGAHATLSWPNLQDETAHEWYVTVDDGESTTTGPRWHFTTAAASPADEGPSVTVHPISRTVTAGESVSFRAAASGTPLPTVQWQVNSGSGWTDISGATSTTYSFTAQSSDNEKQYHAVFTNAAGTATTDPATLTVNEEPLVTVHPASQTVAAGQPVSFTAAASGTPVPTVQWQVNSDSGWTDISGATSPTCSFIAQASDNGSQYRAVFTNAAGTATTNTAALTVGLDLIFKDGFDSGDSSAWSGGVVNGGSLAFVTAGAWSSPYGMAVDIRSNSPVYVVDLSPNGEARYDARFYFNPNSLSMSRNEECTIFSALNGSAKAVISVQIAWSETGYQVRAGLLPDNGKSAYTAYFPLANSWHSIEVGWASSSSPIAKNGGLTFWLDGQQLSVLNAIDNDLQRIEAIRLGAVEGIDGKTRGTPYMDQFESHRESRVGP